MGWIYSLRLSIPRPTQILPIPKMVLLLLLLPLLQLTSLKNYWRKIQILKIKFRSKDPIIKLFYKSQSSNEEYEVKYEAADQNHCHLDANRTTNAQPCNWQDQLLPKLTTHVEYCYLFGNMSETETAQQQQQCLPVFAAS